MPFFVSSIQSFGKRYKNDVRVIFDQWSKLYLKFNAEPGIRILKVIYCRRSAAVFSLKMLLISEVFSSHCEANKNSKQCP